MTDGIIQKVITRYILREQQHDELDLTWYEVNILIKTLEKELIEKIKLEILSIYEQEPYTTAHTLKLIQKNLIGDNQE